MTSLSDTNTKQFAASIISSVPKFAAEFFNMNQENCSLETVLFTPLQKIGPF